MTLDEIQHALNLMIGVINATATKVTDYTGKQSKLVDSQPFEFIGFQARRNILKPDEASLDEQVLKLFDTFQTELQSRVKGPTQIFWRMYPEITITPSMVKITCRVRFAAGIALVKPQIVMPAPQAVM